MTSADRLKDARITAGYRSARSAAIAMGVAVATYVQHENGARQFTANAQDRYLAFFRTNPAAASEKAASGDPEGR